MCHVISVSGRIHNICLKWHLIWISESWKHQNCLEIRRMPTCTYLIETRWQKSSVSCQKRVRLHILCTLQERALSSILMECIDWLHITDHRKALLGETSSASSFLSRRDAIHFHYTADAAWTGLFVIFLSKNSTLTSCVFFYKWLFYNTKRGSFLWTIFSLNSQWSARNYRE